jgi:hypothetical protein
MVVIYPFTGFLIKLLDGAVNWCICHGPNRKTEIALSIRNRRNLIQRIGDSWRAVRKPRD